MVELTAIFYFLFFKFFFCLHTVEFLYWLHINGE
jgi:hypothetical protein